MNCSSPRAAVWEKICFGLVAVCLPPYWIMWLSPNLSPPFRFEIYFKKRLLLHSKKKKLWDSRSFDLFALQPMIVSSWLVNATDFIQDKKTRDWCFHYSLGCCNQLVMLLKMTWLTSWQIMWLFFRNVLRPVVTLAWHHNFKDRVLLPTLRVYITFKVVLHLRPNVMTCRTMITVMLLHLALYYI